MTEAEWRACNEPTPMLEFLRDKFSDRKGRLFACACCRRVWPLLTDERTRKTVAVSEQFADGLATDQELESAYVQGKLAAIAARGTVTEERLFSGAAEAGIQRKPLHPRELEISLDGWYLTNPFWVIVVRLISDGVSSKAERCLAWSIQCELLRDLFGNPFRPSPPLPPTVLTWNDATVRRIAESIYEERRLPEGTLDNGRLAILSDALLDAGCDNEELIAHCRSPGPHVRGCWAIDQILEKT
jgi:hypothetical protein